jgi:hypothetical protein
VGNEIVEEGIAAKRQDARIGQPIENAGHLPHHAGALLAQGALGRIGIVEVKVDLGLLAFAELGETVEQHRTVRIEQLTGLQDVETVSTPE